MIIHATKAKAISDLEKEKHLKLALQYIESNIES
jgi:hypothetical protein